MTLVTLLYFTSPQPIRPKEASDSDFTIEGVMLWPGMRFSLRSQWALLCRALTITRLSWDLFICDFQICAEYLF